MNTFVLESEDLDFLMSEECQMFMYEAAPKVKESFFKRVITKIKVMLQKISDFITSATTKKQVEKIKKVVDASPQLANKKVKIEDYQETYKLGKSALKKLEKAKTKEEADKIVAQYKRNRVIKTVTISVAALATLVAGGKLFMRARNQMIEMDKELSRLEKEAKNLSKNIISAKRGFKKAENRVEDRLYTVAKQDGTNSTRYMNMLSASKKIKKRHNDKLDQMFDGWRPDIADVYDDLYAKYSLGIIRIMGKDLQTQVSEVFQTLKKSVLMK